jgi:hypothetical protein
MRVRTALAASRLWRRATSATRLSSSRAVGKP